MKYNEFFDRLEMLKQNDAPHYAFDGLWNDFRRRGYGDYSRDPYGREASLGAMYGRSPAMECMPYVEAMQRVAMAHYQANPPIVLTKENAMTSASDIKPITNVAIKLLVDQLTSKKNARASYVTANERAETRIKGEKNDIAERGKLIEAEDKAIGELTKALKKLGHTIEK